MERVRRDPELHPVQPDEASRVPVAGAAGAGAGEAAVPVLLGAVHLGALAHNHSAGLQNSECVKTTHFSFCTRQTLKILDN